MNETQKIKKEVAELKAQISFLMGYLSGKDKDFIYRPRQ